MSESCFDPVTCRPRLLAEQCATCVFRPGNPMHLRPGRLRQMVSDALQEGTQGIICHDTLPYGGHPDFGGALCRGFYDSVGYRNNFVRIMERLGGFTEVAPPERGRGGHVHHTTAPAAAPAGDAARPPAGAPAGASPNGRAHG